MIFSVPVQTGPGAHPASCTMGMGSFPGVKSGWGMTLTPHPLLVPWSWKGIAIPLLPLWAVRPVQSLSACTRVHFTFFYLVRNVPITAFRRNIFPNPSNGIIFGYTVVTPTGSDHAAMHNSVWVVVAKMFCIFLNMFVGRSCGLDEKLQINMMSL
jgi:hypothetical protein